MPSSEVNTLLTTLITQSRCWIGFSDINSEGTFTWADGSGVTYTRWNSGEPNNSGGNEDCAELYSHSYWNDAPCTNGIPCYFCGTTGKIMVGIWQFSGKIWSNF